jgi:hypothetical protein
VTSGSGDRLGYTLGLRWYNANAGARDHRTEKNWLVLIEAASSHGPVDHKRYRELSNLFRDSTAGLVFISALPSRIELRKYLKDIAWETDVWCADNPTHLIHFNGERFLGPYS